MMKFLCDVHISYTLRNFLQQQGYEALHVNQILQSQTEDMDICSYADVNDLIVVTKDFDFVDSYYIQKNTQKVN